MASLKKFDTNKAIFVSRLLKAWEKLPELTFGELVAEATETQRLRELTNDEVILALERLALMKET